MDYGQAVFMERRSMPGNPGMGLKGWGTVCGVSRGGEGKMEVLTLEQ